MLNLETAKRTGGSMDEPDLEQLARWASEAHMIAEIGVWEGRSTIALADNTDGVVYAVDHFKGSAEHNQDGRVDPDELYSRFERNIGWRIYNKIWPLRMDSVEAAKLLAGRRQYFDFIFIDASHDYDSIRADIQAWEPLVAVRGILAGHDAGYPLIERACNELLPNREKNIGSHWWWRRP